MFTACPRQLSGYLERPAPPRRTSLPSGKGRQFLRQPQAFLLIENSPIHIIEKRVRLNVVEMDDTRIANTESDRNVPIE